MAENASSSTEVQDLKPETRVDLESEVTSKAVGKNLPDGVKAKFKFFLTPRNHEDSTPIKLAYIEKKVQEKLKADDGQDFKADGENQIAEIKFNLTCDPQYGLEEKKSQISQLDQVISGLKSVTELRDKDVDGFLKEFAGKGELHKYADEKYQYCMKLVKDHRIFYFWSDHAHYHAIDTGFKMKSWLKYFAEPYFPNGVYPKASEDGKAKKSEAWDLFEKLAICGGFCHDIGMGANERHRKEVEALDALKGDKLKDRVSRAAGLGIPLKFWVKDMQRLQKYISAIAAHHETSEGKDFGTAPFDDKIPLPPKGFCGLEVTKDAAEKIEERLDKWFAKQILEYHADGIRSRHSLNGAIYCIDPSEKNALRKFFTEYQLQKMALMVCMHSKSKYGPKKIGMAELQKGYEDIRKNATALVGTDDSLKDYGVEKAFFKRDGDKKKKPWLKWKSSDELKPSKQGDIWQPWGPWLQKQSYLTTVEVDGKAVKNPKQESKAILIDETPYTSILTRAIGVIDNMRIRGNKGDFRDSRGVPFKRVPADVWEKKILDEEDGPKRVATGSFRLLTKHDDDQACSFAGELKKAETYLEALRLINSKHPKLRGLLGDLKDDDKEARLQEVVNPAVLNLVAFHPDNDVICPPQSWFFNIGELNIVDSEITSVGDLSDKPSQLTDKNQVVDRVVIDSDCDPAFTAHIVLDIIKEGPRAFENNWVILIEQDKQCKTPADVWFMQDFGANAYGVFDEYNKENSKKRKKLKTFQQNWTNMWKSFGFWALEGSDKSEWVWSRELFDELVEYCDEPYGAVVYLKSKDGWKSLEQVFEGDSAKK